MITVQLNEHDLEQQFKEELRKHLERLEHRHTFWDMKELCKRTCLSENTIKEYFFYDPRFPKYRAGKKWLFPARECEEFLLMWIKEQPTS